MTAAISHHLFKETDTIIVVIVKERLFSCCVCILHRKQEKVEGKIRDDEDSRRGAHLQKQFYASSYLPLSVFPFFSLPKTFISWNRLRKALRMVDMCRVRHNMLNWSCFSLLCVLLQINAKKVMISFFESRGIYSGFRFGYIVTCLQENFWTWKSFQSSMYIVHDYCQSIETSYTLSGET